MDIKTGSVTARVRSEIYRERHAGEDGPQTSSRSRTSQRADEEGRPTISEEPLERGSPRS